MVSKRVFVGNLLQNYDVCLEELLARFGKFGKCSEDGFEKHDTFAYINIEFEQDADFVKLKQSLNNVKFKGNMLKIDVAKPNWDVRWKLQHEQDLKEEPLVVKQKQEQEWKHYKKVENIKMSWKDRKEIIPGRNRVEKRSRYQLRNSTFRVNVDGALKVYKLYQNKLWGYERDKTAKDLAYQYVNGKWWNNYNHIIDRLDYSRTRSSGHTKIAAELSGAPATSNNIKRNGNETKDPEDQDIDLEEQMIQEEKSKNANILDQFLGEVNLDEPVNVVDSDEAEAFGFSDNEKENDDGYNNNDYQQNNNDEYYNNQDTNYQDDYNNNNNNYNNDYNKNSNQQDNTNEEEQEESEEEFIPTFGAKPATDDQAAGPVQGTVSNTETLRALFNPDTANKPVHMNNTNDKGGFKLIQEDNDDIDQTKNVAEEAENEEEDAFPVATTLLAKTKHQNRLFFPHFDSPFLVGQTQLSQIETAPKNDIWANWEEQFWENRGVWMKEMKNKKRDVLRLKKKRQSKDNNIIMI